jgi:hypothetical protein
MMSTVLLLLHLPWTSPVLKCPAWLFTYYRWLRACYRKNETYLLSPGATFSACQIGSVGWAVSPLMLNLIPIGWTLGYFWLPCSLSFTLSQWDPANVLCIKWSNLPGEAWWED